MLDMLNEIFGQALAYVLIVTGMILIGGFGSLGEWLISRFRSKNDINNQKEQ